MRFLSRVLLAVSLAAVISAPACYGQASAANGEINGTVTDPSAGGIAGATVQVTNIDTGFKQSAKTADSGFYRFTVLPLGTYNVEVQATGFADTFHTGIVVNAGAIRTEDVTLQVGTTVTRVEVAASAVMTDPSRVDLGTTLGNRTIMNLPLVSRNPYNFILFQPNVSGRANTEFGVPRKLNANGFNGRINYQLDGNNNTESDRAGIRLVPISNTYVEEVQQVINGFAPEFGNTVGTVFNTITKSGTNDFHGEAGYIFRRTPMSARPKLTPASSPTPEVNVNDWLADIGGRIKRDKLFFYGSFEHVTRDLPAVVTVPAATIAQLGLPASYANPWPFNQDVYFYMAKGDWMINQKNRLSVRYNYFRNNSPYNNDNVGGQYLVSRAYLFQDRSHVGAIQLISTLSSRAVNELRFQTPYRHQEQNRFDATGSGPALVVSGVAFFGGPNQVGFVFSEMTPELLDNFSYDTSAHTIKVGFGLRWIRDEQVQATAATYTFPSIPAYLSAVSGATPMSYSQFTQTYGNPTIDYNSLFGGWFAQDTWKPARNLTLTYGVRYDVYRPPSANGSSPFPYSQHFRTDKNNFGPRLGIAWGLGAEEKTVIRASTGFFYDPPQTDVYRRALVNNGLPAFFSISATPSVPYAPAFPNVFTSVPGGFNVPAGDIITVSPDFATMYSYNANLTISHELARNLLVSASYLYTSGTRLPVYRNINLVPSGAFLADGRPIFGSARVYPGFANILSAESVGKSNYNGLNVNLQKRFSHGIEFAAYYTWSHAIDDAPEQNNIDASNFLLEDPTNRRRDRGNSLTDKRHSFNMTGVFAPEFKLSNSTGNYLANHNQLAIGLVAASGDLFNIGSNRILNGDSSTSATFQRPLYIGRNTLRAQAPVELNVRYSRFFPIKERYRAEFLAESTNLFNTLNVTGVNSTAQVDPAGNILVPASGAATAARDQRLIQLGARFHF
jgi:hypothetical protein